MKTAFTSTIWVALSGGPDSVVLLHFIHLFVPIYYPHIKIRAIHVNHQLLQEAKDFEKHSKLICKKLHIPIDIVRIKIKKPPGDSLEAKAREARYGVFKRILDNGDILITAHHQSDQAETVLLQLLRGAGLRGVSAMPAITSLGKGFLMRPFLSFPKESLLCYAKYFNLNSIQDPSNQDENFDRNFLRHKVFRLIKQHWPQADKILSRFAKHCAEQEELLETFAAKDYESVEGKHFKSIEISKLRHFSLPRQKNIIRYWIKKQKLPAVSEKILDQILAMFSANTDKNPIVKFDNIQFRRYQNHLFILTKDETELRKAQLSSNEKVWCQQNLNISLKDKNIQICFRQGGEKIKIMGRQHNKSLKNFFQEWCIPPWRRDKIPLIYYHHTLIAVVGYAVAEF